MDVWIVAAAAGAGYIAQHWKNILRMSAMDSSSRNAGEMLDCLTLNYNRTRQASITTELIEIISGASALEG